MPDKPLRQPTDYRLRDPLTGEWHRYGSAFFAGDEEQPPVRDRRNLGEVIDCIPVPAKRSDGKRLTDLAGKTDAKLERNLDRIIHGAVFAAWIAVRSGRLHVDQAFSDRGVIHELVHRYRFGRPGRGGDDSGCTHERLLDLLRMLEAATPELWHPATDHGTAPPEPRPLTPSAHEEHPDHE